MSSIDGPSSGHTSSISVSHWMFILAKAIIVRFARDAVDTWTDGGLPFVSLTGLLPCPPPPSDGLAIQARLLFAATFDPERTPRRTSGASQPSHDSSITTLVAASPLAATDTSGVSLSAAPPPPMPLAHPLPSIASLASRRPPGSPLWGVAFGLSALPKTHWQAILGRMHREVVHMRIGDASPIQLSLIHI